MGPRLDEVSLRRVVDQAAALDPVAWELLYRHSHPRLFAYARRRLPDDATAHDAVSETMTRALERIDGFTWRGAGFDAWLTGILRNVVLEDWRRIDRIRSQRDPIDLTRAGREDPTSDIESQGRAEAVRAAFARLDPDDQELLQLRVLAGLSSDAVAEVVGRSAGAVRMAQSRALDRLRRSLRSDDRV
jgi:RNA polymerase sigma-70 factor, ECF subfamily